MFEVTLEILTPLVCHIQPRWRMKTCHCDICFPILGSSCRQLLTTQVAHFWAQFLHFLRICATHSSRQFSATLSAVIPTVSYKTQYSLGRFISHALRL